MRARSGNPGRGKGRNKGMEAWVLLPFLLPRVSRYIQVKPVRTLKGKVRIAFCIFSSLGKPHLMAACFLRTGVCMMFKSLYLL